MVRNSALLLSIKTLLVLAVLFVLPIENSYADYADNDTCGAKLSLLDRGVNAALTFGVSEAISEGFELENADTAIDSRPEDVDCNKHEDKIRFCYNPWLIPDVERFHTEGGWDDALTSNSTTRCWDDVEYTIDTHDDAKYIDGAWFRAQYAADKICVQVLMTGVWRSMGCKYRADQPLPPPVEPSCFAGESCGDTALRESQSFLPITSSIAQCVSETLNNLFTDTNNACTANHDNLFITFQNSMRKAVSVALTLYVIFFSIKVVLGEELPKKSELFIYTMKIVLVIYFALDDGLSFLFTFLTTVSTELSQIMYQAGGARGLCVFDEADYTNPIIALWDGVDCRMAAYFAITEPGVMPFSIELVIELLSLIFFFFVFIIFLLAFVILFISIAGSMLHHYLLSLIFLTITLYLGPLFIPMVLFKQTKSYFEGWLKLAISFTLQPMILFTFMAFILTIFDDLMFPGCAFSLREVDYLGKTFPVWDIDTSNLTPSDQEACESSFAYQIYALGAGEEVQKIDLIFVTFNVVNTDVINSLFNSLVKLVLFGFISIHFLEVLTGFAAEITGGATLAAVVSSPLNGVKALTGAVTGKKGKKDKKGDSPDQGDGSDQFDQDTIGDAADAAGDA